MTKPIIIVLTFLSIFFHACSEKNTTPIESEEALIDELQILTNFEKRLKEDVVEDKLGSVSASIFKENEIIWATAFGSANKERGTLADTNTIYRTASISKSVTAFLMMLLVQEGIISLDDPIKEFLPEISNLKGGQTAAVNQITFRHLASHTSGLSREPDLEDAASGPIEEWEHKLINAISYTNLNSLPGQKYTYSNIGYGILGLTLARAAGKPYTKLVDEMIFKPLKMTNSFFVIPQRNEAHVAAGYQWHPFTGVVDSEQAILEHKGRGYKVPNGGIYSTPNDLARFLMAHCGSSDLLSKELLDIMHTIQTPENNAYGYGLGFYIRNNDSGLKLIEHDGGVNGYNAYMVFSPDSQIGVVVMRNYNFGRTNIILQPRSVLYQLCKIK
ncbi:MAG: serine hydrolase domain-containing protein [Putridiphycobacter sp.]|nr:serine hydrolase domain-containing protein [Putridiphycobacter sp.]